MTGIDEATLSGLAAVPIGVLADVLCEMGFAHQVVSRELLPIGSRSRFAGPAICVRGLGEAEAEGLPGPLPTLFDVDRLVRPGLVVVVDADDHRIGATIGGLVALAFKQAGAAGFVTDGGVRDCDEIDAMDLPCIARFVTPRSAKGLWSVVAIARAVTLPGQCGEPVWIEPGDIVCSDADGVVIVPANLAAEVLSDAKQVEAAERAILAAIHKGEDRREAYRLHDRFGHIRRRT